MTLDAFEVVDDANATIGAVLVDPHTRIPLAIAPQSFEDADDADTFVRWAAEMRRVDDLRDLEDAAVREIAEEWDDSGRGEWERESAISADEEA